MPASPFYLFIFVISLVVCKTAEAKELNIAEREREKKINYHKIVSP
jgi:hypothetical protein